MTDFYNGIKLAIKNGYLVGEAAVMSLMAGYIKSSFTADELTELLTTLGWTYDSTAKTVSDGTTTYTMYQLISDGISGVYDNQIFLGKNLMTLIITQAETGGYITAAEQTELVEALNA